MAATVLAAACQAAVPAAAQHAATEQEHEAQHRHEAEGASPLFRPREASGTAWLPDETPMYGLERTAGGWRVMLHGSVFAQLLIEPGDRHRTGGFSSHQASSVNWFMVMARRPLGSGRVGIRAMASLEPWTVRDCGFINLLATGEMCEGDTIHDRQHPHDLVMELAADYDRPLGRDLHLQLYAGLAGEPALGPVAFPHRLSAIANPVAPITHHWLDSSHVSFGLLTAGVYHRRWKAEGSLFNGREPDEDRANLDLDRLDSFSGRLTFMPADRLAIQISAARLEDAEDEFPPQPRSDLIRATSSATYHRGVGPHVWATTLAYGVNEGREIVPGDEVTLVTHAVMLESALSLRERHTFFGRAELAGKPGHDLHAHEAPAAVFTVGKVQAGYVRYFPAGRAIVAGVGGTASLSIVPPALALHYSGRVSPGFGVFVALHPARHE